jgi:hypothetical protein
MFEGYNYQLQRKFKNQKQRETYLKDTIIIAQVVCWFVASSCF